MNQTDSDVNAGAMNWVETHGDYLFNFAIGQLRDRNVVWVMLHRARKLLRSELDGWWQGEPAARSCNAFTNQEVSC